MLYLVLYFSLCGRKVHTLNKVKVCIWLAYAWLLSAHVAYIRHDLATCLALLVFCLAGTWLVVKNWNGEKKNG